MPPIIEEQEQLLPGLHSKLLGLALKALSSYALVWAAVIGGGVCWGFTVAHPEPMRIAAASLYCLTVLLPVLVRDVKGGS